jgi:hypothetical protein
MASELCKWRAAFAAPDRTQLRRAKAGSLRWIGRSFGGPGPPSLNFRLKPEATGARVRDRGFRLQPEAQQEPLSYGGW